MSHISIQIKINYIFHDNDKIVGCTSVCPGRGRGGRLPPVLRFSVLRRLGRRRFLLRKLLRLVQTSGPTRMGRAASTQRNSSYLTRGIRIGHSQTCASVNVGSKMTNCRILEIIAL
jgi:hypothetical protein